MSAVAVAIGGCVPEEAIRPMDPTLVVHAVLDARSHSHAVLVGLEHGGFAEGMNNAIVTVTRSDGVAYLARPESIFVAPGQAIRNSGAYRVDIDVAPGETYALRVEASSGVVTGETTVPSAILAPPTPPPTKFERSRDTLKLRWARSAGSARHFVHVQVEGGSRFGYPEYSAFADTSIALPGTMTTPLDGEPLFPTGRIVVVTISAADGNFHDYYRPRTDPLSGSARTRLEGGQGVFGSIVPVLVRHVAVNGVPTNP